MIKCEIRKYRNFCNQPYNYYAIDSEGLNNKKQRRDFIGRR